MRFKKEHTQAVYDHLISEKIACEERLDEEEQRHRNLVAMRQKTLADLKVSVTFSLLWKEGKVGQPPVGGTHSSPCGGSGVYTVKTGLSAQQTRNVSLSLSRSPDTPPQHVVPSRALDVTRLVAVLYFMVKATDLKCGLYLSRSHFYIFNGSCEDSYLLLLLFKFIFIFKVLKMSPLSPPPPPTASTQ